MGDGGGGRWAVGGGVGGVRAARARREGVVGDGGDGRWGGRGASGARAARGRGHRRGASVVRALVIQTTKRKRRGEEEKRKKKRVERRTERRGRREEAKRKKSAARGRGRATAATHCFSMVFAPTLIVAMKKQNGFPYIMHVVCNGCAQMHVTLRISIPSERPLCLRSMACSSTATH